MPGPFRTPGKGPLSQKTLPARLGVTVPPPQPFTDTIGIVLQPKTVRRAAMGLGEEPGLLPSFIPPPPTVGWDDYEGHRYTDWRYGNQTLEADIVGLPILPAPGWDEVEWQKFWGLGYAGPTTEQDAGTPPILPAPGWDEVEWQKFWGLGYAGPTSEEDLGAIPLIPGLAYDEELSLSRDLRFSDPEGEPWHTFFQISIPPPILGWDDYEGHRYTDWRYGNQTFEADIVGLPILPAPGWDEVEWQKFWGLGYAGPTSEEDLGATPIIPGIAREEDLSRSMDTRFASAEEEPWQTFFTIPTPPPTVGWDDWDWSKWYDLRVSQSEEEPRQTFFSIPNLSFDEDPGHNVETRAKQEEEPWQTFFTIPAAPPNQGWDDWDWNRDFSIKYAPPREPEASDFSRPVSPAFGWFDDPLQRYADSGLSQLLVFEEFVNAPSGALPGPFVGCEGGFWMLHSLAASGADVVGGLAASASATVSGLSASGAETVTGMAAGSFCNFSSLSIRVFEVICKE